MTDLFKASQVSDTDAEFQSLVEERFMKDGELDKDAIIKSWIHSQKHIKTVEGDNRTLRDDVNKRMSYEDLLEKLKTTPIASNTNRNEDGTENDGDRNTQNVDIDALVENKLNLKLNQFQQSNIESDNRAFVISELRKAWGDNYVDRLNAEANELGKSPDQINAMAGADPKLLLKALGVSTQVEKKVVQSPAAPRSSINYRGGQKLMSKYEEYMTVRKTDPDKFRSVKFQKEMHDVADQMGDDFYKKG